MAQSFTFDARGNLASANSRSGARQYTFSASGDLDKRSDGTTELGFSFTAEGLLTGITEGTSAVTKVEQNPNGTLHSVAFADGRTAEYKYYPSGLRSQLAYRDGRRVEYNYDAAGNLIETRIFDSNGKQVGGQKLEVDASYRLVGRVQFSGERSTFEYDPNGNLEKIVEGKQITRFEYDSLDRLVAITSADGKRLTSGYQSAQPSALEAYDHSSISVSARVDTGLSFAPASEVFANRPVVGVLGPVRFSSSLGTFQMSNAAGDEVATPDALIEDALMRRRIIGADAQQPLSARQNEFNRPFNSLFIPGEYVAVNCCPLCIAGHFASCFNCDPPPPPPPHIESISVNAILIGRGNVPVTITGTNFGTGPVVSFPSGVTANVTKSSDTSISLSVTVQLTAPVAAGSVTVTSIDTGLVSNTVTFFTDGADHMVVASDNIGVCDGCTTTKMRTVRYDVLLVSGGPALGLPLGEIFEPGETYSCTQPRPVELSATCSAEPAITDGIFGGFLDAWFLSSDNFTPVPCGFDNIVDHWQMCGPATPPTVGTLRGFIHNDAISINGVVSPPDKFMDGITVPK